MLESSRKIVTINWLQNKLINHESGIIFDNPDCSCFNFIQDFVESNHHSFKTPVIYYEAFPDEKAEELIDTLREEITAKLGNPQLYLHKPLSEVVAAAELKMVIIDQSYLYPLNTLEDLLEQLISCNVCLLLVGSDNKMRNSGILSHPIISQWERFIVDNECHNPCIRQFDEL